MGKLEGFAFSPISRKKLIALHIYKHYIVLKAYYCKQQLNIFNNGKTDACSNFFAPGSMTIESRKTFYLFVE